MLLHPPSVSHKCVKREPSGPTTSTACTNARAKYRFWGTRVANTACWSVSFRTKPSNTRERRPNSPQEMDRSEEPAQFSAETPQWIRASHSQGIAIVSVRRMHTRATQASRIASESRHVHKSEHAASCSSHFGQSVQCCWQKNSTKSSDATAERSRSVKVASRCFKFLHTAARVATPTACQNSNTAVVAVRGRWGRLCVNARVC